MRVAHSPVQVQAFLVAVIGILAAVNSRDQSSRTSAAHRASSTFRIGWRGTGKAWPVAPEQRKAPECLRRGKNSLISGSCSLILPRMESAHKRFLPEVLQQGKSKTTMSLGGPGGFLIQASRGRVHFSPQLSAARAHLFCPGWSLHTRGSCRKCFSRGKSKTTMSRISRIYLSCADQSPRHSRNHTLLLIPALFHSSACVRTEEKPAATPNMRSFWVRGSEGR